MNQYCGREKKVRCGQKSFRCLLSRFLFRPLHSLPTGAGDPAALADSMYHDLRQLLLD